MWNITVENQGEEIINLREIIQFLSAFGCEEYLSYLIHAHEVEQGFHIVHCAIVQNGLHQKTVADVLFLGFGRVPKQSSVVGNVFFSSCHAAKIRKNGEKRTYSTNIFLLKTNPSAVEMRNE